MLSGGLEGIGSKWIPGTSPTITGKDCQVGIPVLNHNDRFSVEAQATETGSIRAKWSTTSQQMSGYRSWKSPSPCECETGVEAKS